MPININAQWKKKLQKKHILLSLLFIFGAYAFMTSVLTRGEVLEQAPELAVIEENTSIAAIPRPPLAPQILGDKLVAEESNKLNTTKKQFEAVLPRKAADIVVNQDGEVKIKTTESPKIVLGYKEDIEEAWDICDNMTLAHSFGFNTDNCQTESEIVASAPIAYNTSRGGAGSSVSSSSGVNSGDSSVTEPVDTPEETIITDDENTETDEVIALNTEALLASWIIGGQEMMGQVGDEPSTFMQLSVRPGILVEVDHPYTFKGITVKTTEDVDQVVVHVYTDHWTTWDLNYPEAVDALENLVLTDDDVVLVKVVSQDLATTNWYKAKLFDGEQTPAQTPDFLKIFKVDGNDVLPLTGLEVDYRNINTVDFGANLLIDGFEDAVGVEVLVDDWSDFVKAKVYIYTGHWATWDLLYPGALANLAQTPLTANSIVMLELEDQNGDSFFYRVNLIQGVPEIEGETEPAEMLSSDSSLKILLLAKKDLLSLPGIYLGSEWSPSMTGAVLTVDDLENLEGLFPVANDETAKVKVSIFRDAWTTWENEIGLALLSKENILFGDKIVVEVIAQDGSKSYYQVEIAKNLKVHEDASPIDSLSNQELAKPKEESKEEIKVVEELNTSDVLENSDTTEVVAEKEVVTEISTPEKFSVEKSETTEVLE